MVSFILDNLAAGISTNELIQGHPSLTPKAVRAALAYGADLARDYL